MGFKNFILPFCLLFSACTSFNHGDIRLNSRYVYAKSYVVPLKNIVETDSNLKFFNCGFSEDEYNALYDRGLKKVDGANVLINYTIDYETTIFPIIPFCRTTAKLSGLAAKIDNIK